jgi:hypothetical protein
MNARTRYMLTTLGSLALAAVVCYASYIGADTGISVLQIDEHHVFLLKSCGLAAVAYVIATLVKSRAMWGIVAGLGAGVGAGLFIDMLAPKGYVFSPFVDNALRGTTTEEIIWLIVNAALCFLISWVALKRILDKAQ